MNNDELARQQATGLRALADLIEANPDLAGVFNHALHDSGIKAIPHGDIVGSLAVIARAAKAAGHKVSKKINEQFHRLVIDVAGVKVDVLAYRSEVCERVVTGTETVTKRVPDPVLLAEVPEVEVTEEVETYRWDCKPILAATVDGAR